MKTILINSHDIAELKKLYKVAVDMDMETFTFKGHLVLTAYAKYLLEYIATTQDRDVVEFNLWTDES